MESLGEEINIDTSFQTSAEYANEKKSCQISDVLLLRNSYLNLALHLCMTAPQT